MARARAYVSALGWYRFFVNGRDLTGDALVPRWTPFDQVVEYQSYDVTGALAMGHNVLSLIVGDGRFRGTLGFHSKRAVYGDKLAVRVQLVVEFTDGTSQILGTSADWVAGHGRIVESDPKTGESVDLRVDDSIWWTPRHNDQAVPEDALPVTVLDGSRDRSRLMVAESVAQVRAIDVLPARRVWRSPSGTWLADFGQNLAGVARIRLPAARGVCVELTFSEALTPAGELDTNWILHNVSHPWAQREQVVLCDEESVFQPWFTIHGFRYLEIAGLPDVPAQTMTVDDVEAVVYSTDIELTGSFECSDERVNRLWKNVAWSTRSNFTDTPTDCPTRERSGWTGDLQVFAPTALQLVDCQWFLRRYLENVALEQRPDGRIPVVIPSEISRFNGAPKSGSLLRDTIGRVFGLARDRVWERFGTSVGWGDVAVLTPWEMYQQRGDRVVLEAMYETMRAWVDQGAERAATRSGVHRRFARRRVGHLERFVLDSGYHWGEWLRPGESFPSVLPDNLRTREVVATAYLANSARVLALIAETLGRAEDAEKYADLAANVRLAWQALCLHADGRIGTDRQDDYVRALAFDLLPPDRRSAALERLVKLIEQAGDHLGTGFLSTPMLLPVLVEHGRPDVAYRLLMQDTSPSWLAQVAQGATTIWETWEGFDAGGNARESHNHYSFGSVASWLTRYMVGLRPTSPGYRTVSIIPVIGGGVTHASGSVDTPYGSLRAAWWLREDNRVDLEITLPHGVTATVPADEGGARLAAGPGKQKFSYAHDPTGMSRSPANAPGVSASASR